MNTILGTLRVGLHVMVAFLLFFGVLRAGLDGQLSPIAITLALLLGVVYLVGTVIERRHVLAGTPTKHSIAWLAVVTALWLCLMVCSPDFMWLEFPLTFLFLALTPKRVGLIAATLLWAIAAFLPYFLFPASWSFAAVVGPAIGTIFAVAIYFAYHALRADAEELRATQAELAASEHQAGRLEERERLSREIHDTVAQGLSSILLLSRSAKKSASGPLLDQLTTIEEVAATNLEEARRFVRDLASPDLERSLPDALQDIINRMRSRGHALGEATEFRLNVEGHGQVPETVASACVRAAQEGLNNVVKHSGATLAVVTLGMFDDAVTLDVVDNGSGAESPNGYGLAGLERRIAALGGTMERESTPGEGTALGIRLPLTSEKEH